jgi:23S rRNA (uracil1939-C5)-methyltransferase
MSRGPQEQKRLQAGETIEVLIERILPGGAGLAHFEGQTVLVGLAAPGDRLRVQVERVRKGLAFASPLEVISPSPARVEPPCPYFGRCGGCDFQQLNYPAQLEAKVQIVRDCLRRIARIEYSKEIPITGSPLEWRYRSRAQWQHDPQKSLLGYFERGTHRVCDVVECPVLVPALQETLNTLREAISAGRLPAETTEFQAVAGDRGASLFPPFEDKPTAEVTRHIYGELYRFSAASFFQINHELLDKLVAAAIEGAQGARAVDLYCGAGLFTLPLARRFQQVYGVEASATAAAFARTNLHDAGIANAEVACAPVSAWLKAQSRRLAPVDFLLLDPPRTGAEPGAVTGILALRPRRISYVSCDPATLARDLKELTGGGYTLDTIAAFDMFPQTHHVETVVQLSHQMIKHTSS